jgi:hypothetical protein
MDKKYAYNLKFQIEIPEYTTDYPLTTRLHTGFLLRAIFGPQLNLPLFWHHAKCRGNKRQLENITYKGFR